MVALQHVCMACTYSINNKVRHPAMSVSFLFQSKGGVPLGGDGQDLCKVSIFARSCPSPRSSACDSCLMFPRLEMKVTKSSGGMPRLSYTGRDDRHFLPSGLYIIKTVRGERNVRVLPFFSVENQRVIVHLIFLFRLDFRPVDDGIQQELEDEILLQ